MKIYDINNDRYLDVKKYNETYVNDYFNNYNSINSFVLFSQDDKVVLGVNYNNKIETQEMNKIEESIIKNYLFKMYNKSDTQKKLLINKIKKMYPNLDYENNDLSGNLDKIIQNDYIKEELKKKFIPDMDQNQIVEQEGGILIWIADKILEKLAEKNFFFLLLYIAENVILSIIDLILDIAGAVPGLQALYGAGIIIDVVGIVLSILRFDVIGLIAALFSLIPVVGDILGGLGGIGSNLIKSIKFIFKIGKVISKIKAVKDAASDVAGYAEMANDLGDDEW